MRVPYTVNKKILELYQPPTEVITNKGRIQAADFEQWDKGLPRTLKEHCIQTIARNWRTQPLFKELPQLTDRLLLLDLLATDLPLELTVPIIHEDVYWKRCYYERWPKHLPKNISEDVVYPIYLSASSSRSESDISSKNCFSNNSGETQSSLLRKPWKYYYLEMHFRDFLEFLAPEEYDPEKIKHLTVLCAPYVSVLNLKQMQCSENGFDHISLSAVLSGLSNLTELSITFQQAYVKEAFSWDIFKTSLNDIRNLCKAFDKASKLRVLRITRSDVDSEKFTLILNSLVSTNTVLKEIDFSSCKISDTGVLALCEILEENNSLEKVTLANNQIGAEGAKALSKLVSEPTCTLNTLNLRLNNIGSVGGKCLIDSLASPLLTLQELILAGCGIKSKQIDFVKMLKQNKTLLRLDLSNNRFGEDVGKRILKGLEYNTTLENIDLRRCDLTSETKYAIKNLIHRNKTTII